LSQFWEVSSLPFMSKKSGLGSYSTGEDFCFLPGSGIAVASTSQTCSFLLFTPLQPLPPLLLSAMYPSTVTLLPWLYFTPVPAPVCTHRRKTFSAKEELPAPSYSCLLHGFFLSVTSVYVNLDADPGWHIFCVWWSLVQEKHVIMCSGAIWAQESQVTDVRGYRWFHALLQDRSRCLGHCVFYSPVSLLPSPEASPSGVLNTWQALQTGGRD